MAEPNDVLGMRMVLSQVPCPLTWHARAKAACISKGWKHEVGSIPTSSIINVEEQALVILEDGRILLDDEFGIMMDLPRPPFSVRSWTTEFITSGEIILAWDKKDGLVWKLDFRKGILKWELLVNCPIFNWRNLSIVHGNVYNISDDGKTLQQYNMVTGHMYEIQVPLEIGDTKKCYLRRKGNNLYLHIFLDSRVYKFDTVLLRFSMLDCSVPQCLRFPECLKWQIPYADIYWSPIWENQRRDYHMEQLKIKIKHYDPISEQLMEIVIEPPEGCSFLKVTKIYGGLVAACCSTNMPKNYIEYKYNFWKGKIDYTCKKVSWMLLDMGCELSRMKPHDIDQVD